MTDRKAVKAARNSLKEAIKKAGKIAGNPLEAGILDTVGRPAFVPASPAVEIESRSLSNVAPPRTAKGSSRTGRKEYAGDPGLVKRGLVLLEKGLVHSPTAAATGLAAEAEGNSEGAKIDRLRKKIAKKWYSERRPS